MKSFCTCHKTGQVMWDTLVLDTVLQLAVEGLGEPCRCMAARGTLRARVEADEKDEKALADHGAFYCR